jgi:uncharacterized membrane protein (DUF106 family)
MNPTSADPERLETLRARAEVLNDKLQKVSSQTDDEATKLLHELRTYQIELELQNDDLRQFQIALQELGAE